MQLQVLVNQRCVADEIVVQQKDVPSPCRIDAGISGRSLAKVRPVNHLVRTGKSQLAQIFESSVSAAIENHVDFEIVEGMGLPEEGFQAFRKRVLAIVCRDNNRYEHSSLGSIAESLQQNRSFVKQGK
jgi:hypothetical protein